MALRSLNNPIASFIDYLAKTGTDTSTLPPQIGLTATGGIISDYTDPGPGAIYRAHIFTSSGTFTVSSIGAYGSNIEYLVVAGGGGGGSYAYAGGGGAGGFRTNVSGHPLAGSAFPVSTSPGSYTVTVGAGAASVSGNGVQNRGNPGSNSVFAPGYVGVITATGGGGGGTWPTLTGGLPGGSGGGGGSLSGGGGAGNISPTSPPQGNPGGNAAPAAFVGGGGGGAGSAGSFGSPSKGGDGGIGTSISIATGISTFYAGGGGGAEQTLAGGTGGAGGGGSGGSAPVSANGIPGIFATGGGGGGGAYTNAPVSGNGGAGGSGIVVVRYQIDTLQTGTAKATGGAISYYGGKTIHTFTSSGTFTAPGSFNETIEYVVIGGGGSGGYNSGGGGGAGAYRVSPSTVLTGPQSITVQVGSGGAGISAVPSSASGNSGSPSYFGTPITSPGGGAGGNSAAAGSPGGSGGGGVPTGGTATGAPFPGTIGVSPASGWGHPGGVGAGAGGGGAGGAGAAGAPSPGNGGIGIQLPATFRNPASLVGAPGPTSPPVIGADTSGKYYVAQGGGGYPSVGTPGGGGGFAPSPGDSTSQFAAQNTGSGGGAYPGSPNGSGNGGSGIVLIAYPS